MASIQVLEGRERGGRIALGKEGLILGRRLDCDVVFPHPAVARRNARLVREGDQYEAD
jgi:pSer/pThr/pTyr-binding forkhead associated (FHA) protein